MLTYWEILTAIQSNVPVNDSYAQGQKIPEYCDYTGTLPATLTGLRQDICIGIRYTATPSRRPTPENPITEWVAGRGRNLMKTEGTGWLFRGNAGKQIHLIDSPHTELWLSFINPDHINDR